MEKGKVGKIVGFIDKNLCKKWCLEDYSERPIIQSLGLYVHIAKHASEFISVDSFNYTIDHINDVIIEPDYVYYNQECNSLEYYKRLMENVCVIVKLNNKRELYVGSLFPATENKINGRKLKEAKIIEERLIKKYTHIEGN